MSTWEERMSQRAKGREAEREEAEAERIRQQYAHLAEAMPGLPGEDRISLDSILKDHAGHLAHWCKQQMCSMCSCGACVGTAAIVAPEQPPPPCEICRTRQIGAFAPTGNTRDAENA